jgi:hypothetical protein
MQIILRCYELKRQLPVDSTDVAAGVGDLIETRRIELENVRYRLAVEKDRSRSQAVF